MDDLLLQALELCREAVIIVRDGIVEGLNRAAKAAFPQLRPGVNVGMLLPRSLLDHDGDAAAFAELDGKAYTVRSTGTGARRFFVCTPVEDAGTVRGVLSDGVMNQLLSSVGSLQLAAELLTRGPLPESEAQEQAILMRSCYKLRRQLGNLRLALALMEERQPFFPEGIELVTFCGELFEAVESATADLGVALRFHAAQPELYAEVDPALIEQMLLNLFSNSLRHTPAGGTVTLSLEGAEGRISLTVRDDGEGIPPEILDTVFRRYTVRADTDRPGAALTGGLGLAIASGIARLHGGTMVLESRPGQGTVARVSLPAHRGSGRLAAGAGLHRSPAEAVRTALADLMELKNYTGRYLD